MSKGKGLLFLAYYFPPIRSIAVWRNYFLAKEARSIFDKIYVFTTDNNKRFPQEDIDISSFDITSLTTYDYRRLFSSAKSSTIAHQEYTKQHFISRLSIKLLNSFPVSFLIGEGGLIYILHGYRKAKKLVGANELSHIYSSYRPMADHWIGYLLKRKYPQLHWTADFRDLPFDPVYKNYLWKGFQDKVLRLLLKKADIICSFAKGLSQGLEEYTDKEVNIIPNGLFLLPTQSSSQVLQQKFTIQYTGSLFLRERDPGILFKTVAELINQGLVDSSDFCIQYAGKDGTQWQSLIDTYSLNAVSIISGELTTAEARILQQKANINLLLTSAQPGFTGIFTGKFYEYIGSSRPMLVIINGMKDEEFEAVFSKYKIGKLAYNHEDQLKDIQSFIVEIYNHWRLTGVDEWKVDEGIVRDFSWGKSLEVWEKVLGLD